MAFRDVLKKQRTSGSGFISSVGAASMTSVKEKIDPRNYLFKSGSLLNALFPKVKGYQYKDNQEKFKTPGANLNATLATDKLDGVIQRLDIVGKNTMVLPMMSRDMNIARQSLVKLVKLNGGTQRDKADRFFSRSKEIENLYESKIGMKSTSPTKVGEKQNEKSGFFAGILSALAGNLLTTIVKGGLITGALFLIGKQIRTFFEDPKFREKIMSSIGDVVKDIALGLAAVVGVFAAFKLALAGLVGAVGRAAFGLSGGKGAGVAGSIPAVVATVLGTSYLEKRVDEIKKKIESGELSGKPEMTTTDKVVAGGTAATAGYLGVKGVQNVVQASKTTATAILDARTQSPGQLAKSTPKTKWGKFLVFVAKRDRLLWGKVASKLAVAGTLAVVPVAGWIAAERLNLIQTAEGTTSNAIKNAPPIQVGREDREGGIEAEL